ncbi:MAG: cysteine desulfurase family protein [Desulfomonilia bacterium]
MDLPVYLDYNATTPIDPDVLHSMLPFLECEFGNPSSSHWYGISPKKAILTAREQVATLIGCSPHEIVFTSGGTEANNHAIVGIAKALIDRGNHIITSVIEHPAVLEPVRFLEDMGFEVTRVGVDTYGIIDGDSIRAAMKSTTTIISIMHANNEIGSIQPIREISEFAHSRGCVLHTDAAQSLGKIDVRVDDLGADLLSIAGHKVYAPKGVGALYIRKGIFPETFMHGATQESGRRAGTENVASIVGLGTACEILRGDLPGYASRMTAMRDRLCAGIMGEIDGVRLNGHPDKRLPNTLNLSFQGLDAPRILEEIGLEVAASAGAACHADSVEISHVLRALRIPEDWARGTIRLSTGRMTTQDEIDRSVAAIVKAVRSLRSEL